MGTTVGVRLVSAVAVAGFMFLGQLTAAVSADSSPSPTSSPSPSSSPTPPVASYPSAVITLSSGTGLVGSPVVVGGSGFPPSTDYAVYLDNPDLGYAASPARLNGGVGPQTDSHGSL